MISRDLCLLFFAGIIIVLMNGCVQKSIRSPLPNKLNDYMVDIRLKITNELKEPIFVSSSLNGVVILGSHNGKSGFSLSPMDVECTPECFIPELPVNKNSLVEVLVKRDLDKSYISHFFIPLPHDELKPYIHDNYTKCVLELSVKESVFSYQWYHGGFGHRIDEPNELLFSCEKMPWSWERKVENN